MRINEITGQLNEDTQLPKSLNTVKELVRFMTHTATGSPGPHNALSQDETADAFNRIYGYGQLTGAAALQSAIDYAYHKQKTSQDNGVPNTKQDKPVDNKSGSSTTKQKRTYRAGQNGATSSGYREPSTGIKKAFQKGTDFSNKSREFRWKPKSIEL
jgi:hypothetical protein